MLFPSVISYCLRDAVASILPTQGLNDLLSLTHFDFATELPSLDRWPSTSLCESTMDFDIDRFLSRAVPRSRLYLLPDPVSWFMGYRSSPQRPLGNVLVWFWAFVGAVVGLLVVEAVFRTPHFRSEGAPLIVASLV